MSRAFRHRRAVGALVLATGALLLVLPWALGALYGLHANAVVSQMSRSFEPLEDPVRLEVLAQARAYNAWLAGGPGEGVAPYAEQMRYRNVEPMAYVEAPDAGVRLPVYHGTSDASLSAGAGHLEGSSLPVGGEPSHCVLTAHSGLVSARMFDGIGRLREGDRFVVWALGEPYAYEVYATETVLPDEVSSLGIVEGKDLCTLVTCTQLGTGLVRTNTHRLLVHGRRCVWEGAAPVAEGPDAVPDLLCIAACVAAAASIAVLGAVARRAARSRREKGD